MCFKNCLERRYNPKLIWKHLSLLREKNLNYTKNVNILINNFFPKNA